MKDDYIKNVKSKIKQFSDFLGDKKWFGGAEVYVCVCVFRLCCLSIFLTLLSTVESR